MDPPWDAYVQRIDAELAKLERDGAVMVEPVDLHHRPTKKIYSLTAAGHEALDEWLRHRPVPIRHKEELRVTLYCLELAVRHFEERLDELQAEVREVRRRLAGPDLADIGYGSGPVP